MEARTFAEIFTKGKFSGQARYRYEIYEQDASAAAPIVGTGVASTLRLALGFETAPFFGLSAFIEGEAVIQLGAEDRYRIPTVPDQNNAGYPIIVDPEGIELSQFWLNWKIPATPVELRVGREELSLLNGRFIGNSAWRQNHQALDLASIKASFDVAGGRLLARYAYMNRIYRTLGYEATDSPLYMDSHFMNLEWAKKDRVTASAYGILLDYDRPDQAYLSTSTIGLRVFGPWMINPDWGIHYVADFAHQADYGGNPFEISSNYWALELGPQYKGHKLYFGWTVLEGESTTDKVTTPLAPPNNGWVEKFLLNPSLGDSHGLNAIYLTATGPVPFVKGLTYTVTFYDYHSDSNRIHYGSELDAQLEYKFAKHYAVGWRFGNYWADNLFTDSLRTSVFASFTF